MKKRAGLQGAQLSLRLLTVRQCALGAIQGRRRYAVTIGMFRVRVDVFVEVVEGPRIGLTGPRTPSNRLWIILSRRGVRMLVGGDLR
jgi:hypothetical protein